MIAVPCKGCGKHIYWITMKSGKSMPVDPKLITIVTEYGYTQSGYEAHWGTCEKASQFRKEKKDD